MATQKQKLALLKTRYAEAVTDSALITGTADVVGDILRNAFPSHELVLPFATVGEVKSCPGFYKDAWLIDHMIATFIGRYIHAIAKTVGIDPSATSIMDPGMMEFLQSTDEQQHRCIPHVIAECVKRYGDVPVVDTSRFNTFK